MVLFILLVIGIFLFFYAITIDSEDLLEFSIVLTIVMAILVSTITGIAYTYQVRDITELNVIEKRMDVYKERAEMITLKLKSVIENYVDHEEIIFNKISPSDIQLYAAKYPEIRSDKLYSEYNERLIKLYDSIYRLKQDEISLSRNIERRKRYHLHVFTPLIPRE